MLGYYCSPIRCLFICSFARQSPKDVRSCFPMTKCFDLKLLENFDLHKKCHMLDCHCCNYFQHLMRMIYSWKVFLPPYSLAANWLLDVKRWTGASCYSSLSKYVTTVSDYSSFWLISSNEQTSDLCPAKLSNSVVDKLVDCHAGCWHQI